MKDSERVDLVTTHAGTDEIRPENTEYTELVRSAMAGDAGALEELLARSQSVVRRFSDTVCGGKPDSEDAAQEALIKTYRYVQGLRDPESFRAWLYRTVKNACLLGRRKRAGEPSHLESIETPDADDAVLLKVRDRGKSPEELAENAKLREQLRDALMKLPQSHRVIVFLREMEGLSTREVAEVVGISEDNVKARLSRARARLRRELQSAARGITPRDP
jgi:RNA polymerase sigma-70 factor (ECF subfamily)